MLDDENDNGTDCDGGGCGGGDRRREHDQLITPDEGRTMAIDTRSSTSAGGADDAPAGSRPGEPAEAPGTAGASERLVPEMTASTASTVEHDARFEAEALPWIDDVY